MSRLDDFIDLPAEMDPQLRIELTEILRDHARQLNKLSQDTTRVSSTQVVAVPLVLADAAANALVLTLPPALAWDDAIIRIKKMDSSANAVKVQTSNSETIDGTLTVAISIQYTSLQILSAGDQWVIV